MIQWSKIRLTDGTDQESRLAAALEPGYFNVDELTFEALLSMAAEFAARVNFYNLRNQPDGSWAELFSADEAVIMAMILSVDLKSIEAEFLRRYPSTLEQLTAYVFQRAATVNFWFTKLSRIEHMSGDCLRKNMATVIEEKLVPELHNLGLIMAQLRADGIEIAGADFAAFGTLWRLEYAGPDYQFPLPRIPAPQNTAQTRQQLRSVFYAFFNATSYLKTITPRYLQQSLGSELHNPATGLFMAFLKLYQKAQQKLNSFTGRHLDFYYNHVLKATPHGHVPQSVYLGLEAEAATQGVLIPKGTQFSAGKDQSLNEIIYRADHDLVVTDARVKSLYTLYLQRDQLVSPEYELGYVSRIKSNKPELPGVDIAENERVAWPLFGVDKPGVTGGTAADARIGFAVASPVLLLNEGQRKVELSVILEDRINSDAALMVSRLNETTNEQAFIELFGKLFSRYLLNSEAWLGPHNKAQIIAKAQATISALSAKQVKKLLGEDWHDLFYKLFKKVFTIRLTTASGWFEVEDYLVIPLVGSEHDGKTGFRLCFTLGPEVDAINTYNAEIHGPGFAATAPLLECCINPQSNFYPYCAFDDLLVKTVVIDAAVSGVKSIKLYNNNGQLDPSKPFQPFGPLPSCNSYLVLGNYEIARKNLVELSIQLEWAELPAEANGFEAHYEGYGKTIGNDSFKAELSVLVDGGWKPRDAAERKRESLFATDDKRGRVTWQRSLNVPLSRYARNADATIPEDQFDYGLGAREGFFRLSLVEPEIAFGHRQYATLLTEVLSANAKLKKPKPVPNPPYTPTLNQVALTYKATSSIAVADQRAGKGLKEERFYHLHPFGIEPLGPSMHEKPAFLLPQYGYEGNLFIGIWAKQLKGPLSLYFHLSEDLVQEVGIEKQMLCWFYLASDTWKVMPKARVLSDTTEGFLTSGIVTLDIPGEINRHNSVMPNEYYWLRLSARKKLLGFCSLYSVQSHAIKVTGQRPVDTLAAAAAPAKPWRPMASIPGVGKVTRLGRVFGGTAAETRSQFVTRISERLRHKNRASSPWDYERLVLERFPHVFKVKCFANMSSSEGYPHPGHVLIVVVPYLHKGERCGCPTAMMNSVALSHIRAFVRSIASPFAEIEVRNPVYEQVQVRCTVKFNRQASGGDDINQLNKAISDYISPWERIGNKARFGWSIRQKNVESYIRNLDYVDFVTNFSMLHITERGKACYELFDTAKDEANQEALIRPHYPWGLPTPAKHHFIETVHTSKPIKAQVTGIAELEIGGTFIISGNDRYGKEE